MDRIDDDRMPWAMETAIIDPEGIRVQVKITVPPGHIWDDKAVGDCTEIAQMTAATAMTHLNKCRQIAADKVPF
jgi:hypothetical protein